MSDAIVSDDLEAGFDFDNQKSEPVDHKGQLYFTGLHLPKPSTASAFPDASAVVPELSESDIAALLKDPGRARRRKLFGPDTIANQRQFSSCFPAGTLVRMADGSHKRIEAVQTRDEVVTAEGRTGRVLGTMVRPHAGHLLRLHVWGHRHLRCTPDHLILTKRGYVRADELTADDWIALPRHRGTGEVRTLLTSEVVSVRRTLVVREGGSRKQRYQIPGKSTAIRTRIHLPDVIELTAGFGRILGYFLAEGSTSAGTVVFTFSDEEFDTLAAELVQLLHAELGIEASRTVNHATHTTKVTVSGVEWSKLFTALGGNGADEKQLHPSVTDGPPEFVAGILDAWQAGDGLGDPDRNGGVTVSPTLAAAMYDMAQATGYRPTVETLQVKINPKHKIKRRKLRYIVAWPKRTDRGNDWRSEQTDTHVYRRFVEAVPEPFTGDVFDLTVEGDHSFVAEGVGVHNCNGWACARALARARVLAGQEWVPLSGAAVYAQINGGRDQGSMLDDGMRELQTKGTVSETVVPADRIYLNQIPASVWAEALKYLGFECYQTGSKALLLSGLALGWVGVVAVHVGNNYMRLNAEGVAGVDRGPGNHAVCVDDAIIGSSGRPLIDSPGSWGPEWGDQGRCYFDYDAHLAQTSNYHRFFLVRGATLNPDNPQPPAAKV